MQEISAKIVIQKINSSSIIISRKLPKKFELSIECRAKLKSPEIDEDKKVLLNIQLNISTKDEKLKIELVSDIVFELSQIPDDFNEFAERKLVMMANEKLLSSLDDMLEVMGHKKMELAKSVLKTM